MHRKQESIWEKIQNGTFLHWLLGLPEKKKRGKVNVLNLEVGDIINYDMEDYEITGKIIYEDAGFYWYDYNLEGKMWLAVEEDCGELYVGIFKDIDIDISEPIPRVIFYEDEKYIRRENGLARVTAFGQRGARQGSAMEYYDYSTSDGTKQMSVEIWGSNIEVSAGVPIRESELKIYPRGSNE